MYNKIRGEDMKIMDIIKSMEVIEIVIVSLFSFAILLLLISFFKRDHIAKLEEELEQTTLTQLQEMYQLKKKVRILEEELMIQEEPKAYFPATASEAATNSRSSITAINEIIKSQVLALYRQGRTLEEIGQQSTLTREQIVAVINEQQLRGEYDE